MFLTVTSFKFSSQTLEEEKVKKKKKSKWNQNAPECLEEL